MTEKQVTISFDGRMGSLQWTLPPDAAAAMQGLSPSQMLAAEKALGDNINVCCAALLSTFGNPGKLDTMKLIIAEMRDLVNR